MAFSWLPTTTDGPEPDRTVAVSAIDLKVLVPILAALEAQLADEGPPELLTRLRKDLRRYGLSASSAEDGAALAAIVQRLQVALRDIDQ